MEQGEGRRGSGIRLFHGRDRPLPPGPVTGPGREACPAERGPAMSRKQGQSSGLPPSPPEAGIRLSFRGPEQPARGCCGRVPACGYCSSAEPALLSAAAEWIRAGSGREVWRAGKGPEPRRQQADPRRGPRILTARGFPCPGFFPRNLTWAVRRIRSCRPPDLQQGSGPGPAGCSRAADGSGAAAGRCWKSRSCSRPVPEVFPHRESGIPRRAAEFQPPG